MAAWILLAFLVGPSFAALDNRGKEFIVGFMDNKIAGSDISPELFITTPKHQVVHVSVTAPKYPNASLNEHFTITNGQVHYLQIDPSIRHHSTEMNSKGILIQSDKEIAVYGVNREKHSDDGYLALPTSTLGKEYYTVSYSPALRSTVFLITGVLDSTNVFIHLAKNTNVSVTYNNITYMGGDWLNVTMNRLDTFELASSGDLTGTHIISDLPISVLSGNKKTNVGKTGSQDHLVEQLIPVQSWGKHFATVPIPDRLSGDIFRFVASKDNTTVRVNGTINGKHVHDRFTIAKAGSYVQKHYSSHMYASIKSNQPIQLVQFSLTQLGNNDVGDPSMIVVPPVEQYATDYSFTTPKYSQGNYTNYFMFVIKGTDRSGLRIDGNPVSHAHFHHIPGTHLVGGYVKITPGTHTVDHTSPTSVIGGILFGQAKIESYGFPVGLLLSPINSGCVLSKMSPGDEVDNDCDGQVDEETCNGEDDDEDGRIDEDCKNNDDLGIIG